MKVIFEEGSVIKTVGFTIVRDNGEKVEGLINEELIYVGGQETHDISIETSSKSDNLTPEEEQKLLNMYREEI
jgi:hypothetical protein